MHCDDMLADAEDWLQACSWVFREAQAELGAGQPGQFCELGATLAEEAAGGAVEEDLLVFVWAVVGEPPEMAAALYSGEDREEVAADEAKAEVVTEDADAGAVGAGADAEETAKEAEAEAAAEVEAAAATEAVAEAEAAGVVEAAVVVEAEAAAAAEAEAERLRERGESSHRSQHLNGNRQSVASAQYSINQWVIGLTRGPFINSVFSVRIHHSFS